MSPPISLFATGQFEARQAAFTGARRSGIIPSCVPLELLMNLLSSLRYLIALSEHRHFGRAAAASHITQPALSNALRALEAEFGVTIVHRGRTFVGFTPEGERVLLAARNLLRERDLLTQDLLNRTDEPQGALSIAAVPSALPVACRRFAR